MKNKKGFTLVEILVTIVILSILILTIIASITKYIEESHNIYDENTRKEFLLSGKNFYADNTSRIPTSTSNAINDIVTAQELASKNYLTKTLKDSNKNNCMEESYVVVRYNENNKANPSYIACIKCGNNESLTLKTEKEYCKKEIIERPKTCNPQIIETTKNENNKTQIKYYLTEEYIEFEIDKIKVQEQTVLINANLSLISTTDEYKTSNIKYTLWKYNNTSYEKVKTESLEKGNKQVLLKNKEQDYKIQKYKITFTANDNSINMKKDNINIDLNVETQIQYNFNYKEQAQEFKVPSEGKYKIELWGAAGNYYPKKMKDQVGKGAYTSGVINLEKGTILYIYTGKNATDEGDFNTSSFNAGSTAAGKIKYTSGYHNSSSGGGATDVRLIKGKWNDESSLKSRIMVAAGGGGTQYFNNENTKSSIIVEGKGGAGGGLIGYQGYQKIIETYSKEIWDIQETDGTTTKAEIEKPFSYVSGGTQMQGGKTNLCHPNGCNAENKGKDGTFGIAGSGSTSEAGGGGGGGYYGGAGGGLVYPLKKTTSGMCHSSGAGGSSYISGHTGSISYANRNNKSCIETGNNPETYKGTTTESCSYYNNEPKYIFTKTLMIDGLNYRWTNKRENKLAKNYSNNSSGKARITALTKDSSATFKKEGAGNCKK